MSAFTHSLHYTVLNYKITLKNIKKLILPPTPLLVLNKLQIVNYLAAT